MCMESLTRLFCQVKLLLAVILLQFGYVVHYRQVCFEPGDESLCAYRMSIATAPFAIVLERFPPLF